MLVRPRHSGARRGRLPLRRKLVVGGAAVALAAGVTVVAQGSEASAACDPGRVLLRVVASPDIAGVVARLADGVRDDEGCPRVDVRAETGADVLTALGRSTAPPDVWIPDSSLWVARAVEAQLVSPTGSESIASSPLVLAVPAALQDRLADGAGTLAWPAAVAALAAGDLVLHVPAGGAGTAAPSTVGALGALAAAVHGQPDARAALTRLLRAVQVDPRPESTGTSALAGLAGDGAVAVPEQAVRSRHGEPGAPAVAAVHPPGGTPFDYPFTTVHAAAGPGSDAGRLLAALRSPRGQQALRAEGFRGRDVAVAVPGPAAAADLLGTFEAVRRDARLLAVLDVSGSMAAPVPGAGGSTRLDLALRAVAAGMELYPDATDVGLWSFAEDPGGGQDHQELVPIAGLTDPAPGGRAALSLALTQLRAVPNGGTGLFDTALAAVRAVRAGWDPARVNAVVLLTDGADTDAHGIGLDELVATLRAEQAPGRPVPVITIAYGDDSGAEALAAISAATDGAAYQTSDPGRILQIFLDAVGQRACRPACEPGPGR